MSTDPRFEHGIARFREWKAEFDSGDIQAAQFEKALDESAFVYAGHYWMVGAASGRWYRSQGDGWVGAEPPTLEDAAATEAKFGSAQTVHSDVKNAQLTPLGIAESEHAKPSPHALKVKIVLWLLLILAVPALSYFGVVSELQHLKLSAGEPSRLVDAMLIGASFLLTLAVTALFPRVHFFKALLVYATWSALGFVAYYFNLGRGVAMSWWPGLLLGTGIAAVIGCCLGAILRRSTRH